MNTFEVVGLGALNIDHIYKVERILDDGEAVVNEAKSSPGGSAANTIYALAKLGISAAFVGAVGDDDEGKILLQDFQTVGVDISQIRVKSGAKTGSVLCLSDRLGRRSLYVLPGANNRLTIDDLDLAYINQARILHLSSFADDKQFKVLLQLIDKLDPFIKISFAPGALYAIKGLKALAPILSRTYILFLNQDEIRQLTGEDVIDGAKRCLEQGCQKVVITLGEGKRQVKGIRLEVPTKAGRKRVSLIAYIRDTEKEYVVSVKPQYRVPTVDTIGAGDAFAAGFLYGLLKRKSLKECGRLGNIAAQFCISQIGAREGLPTRSELAKRYREFYSQPL